MSFPVPNLQISIGHDAKSTAKFQSPCYTKMDKWLLNATTIHGMWLLGNVQIICSSCWHDNRGTVRVYSMPRSWVGPACHWMWGSMAIEAKRPQHHLQASVPPAPSPVLHQASTCGLHLWPAEKPHRIKLCLCQLTILAESKIGKSLTP